MSFKTVATGDKLLVRDYIERVVNTGDTSRVAFYISPDYAEVSDNETHKVGIEGAIDHIRGVRETYPDLTLHIDMQIAEGNYVVTCYTMTGTHSGEWMGIKPTGKKIRVKGVNVDKVVNGKIVEHGGAANLLHPLLEAGALVIK